jgi:hypothetical protein
VALQNLSNLFDLRRGFDTSGEEMLGQFLWMVVQTSLFMTLYSIHPLV